MNFLILAAVLGLGAAFIVPIGQKLIFGFAPSLTSNRLASIFVVGVLLAGTLWAGSELLGKRRLEP